MSPEAIRAISVAPRMAAYPCKLRCPLATGCDRASSRNGRAVTCPVLGDRRVALAPFVPVRRRASA
jgi:hypothetical protein